MNENEQPERAPTRLDEVPAPCRQRHHAYGPDGKCALCGKVKGAKAGPRTLGERALRLQQVSRTAPDWPQAESEPAPSGTPMAPGPAVSPPSPPIPAAPLAAVSKGQRTLAKWLTHLFVETNHWIATKRGKEEREPDHESVEDLQEALAEVLPDGPVGPWTRVGICAVGITIEIQRAPNKPRPALHLVPPAPTTAVAATPPVSAPATNGAGAVASSSAPPVKEATLKEAGIREDDPELWGGPDA